MCRVPPGTTRRLWLPAALSILLTACAAPPNEEIAEAETALKTARAAGAEQYAPEPYAAAAEAYRLANQAVLAGDYRLALNRALESRNLAQTAIRQAEDVDARVRDEVHAAMIQVAILLARAGSRVDDVERSKAPRRIVREARDALAGVNDDVQKAGAAMQAGDYATAKPILADVTARLQALLDLLDATGAQSATRAP